MSKPAFQPLVNLGGSNFCFMNAIIQNLWNIKGFRDTLISGSIPHPSNHGRGKCTCIYCSLRDFMILYDKQTKLVPLSATEFRNSLAEFYNTRANDMEDSYEVFQDLLNYIHSLSGFCENDMTKRSNTHCLGHHYFGFTMNEKSICSYCGEEVSNPQCCYFYSVTVEQLFTGMDYYKSMNLPKEDYLANLLLYSMKTDYPRCLLSAGCPGQFCKCDVLSSFPLYLTMSFVYATDYMPKDKLRPLYYSLVMPLRADLLTRDPSQQNSNKHNYHLCGMILYYGHHYVAMCLYEFEGKFYWMECNDTKFRHFTDNASMIEHCVKSAYQPVLLFYQLDNTESVMDNQNPTTVVPVNPQAHPDNNGFAGPTVVEAFPNDHFPTASVSVIEPYPPSSSQQYPPAPVSVVEPYPQTPQYPPAPVTREQYPPTPQQYPPAREDYPPPAPQQYPPAPQQYPPPAREEYPPAPREQYPPAPQQYPPAPQQYPPAPQQYPPAPREEYPPAPREQYPPAPQQYPPAPQQYPPAREQYPPAPQQYPPAPSQQYPPAREQYPPAPSQQYPPSSSIPPPLSGSAYNPYTQNPYGRPY